jgi:hypothetical protein
MLCGLILATNFADDPYSITACDTMSLPKPCDLTSGATVKLISRSE